jgi:SAM-dependent methyltransferase
MKFSEWYYREKINFALDRIEFTGDKVFDLGFGHGGILKLMENDGWTTAGVEPDQSLFQYAKNKLQLSHIHQVVFDENFDCESEQGLVVSNHTFEHIADLDSTMKGLIKMMRPGGYMLTVIPTYFRNRSPLSKLWMNAGHYSMFNHRSLSQLCARYGLEEVAYTYRGWRKEIDDLWHLARFTGEQIEPTLFYEDPEEVESYVNFWNPLNSIMYWPLHGPVGSFAKRRAAKLGIGKTIQKIRSQLAGKRGRAA